MQLKLPGRLLSEISKQNFVNYKTEIKDPEKRHLLTKANFWLQNRTFSANPIKNVALLHIVNLLFLNLTKCKDLA